MNHRAARPWLQTFICIFTAATLLASLLFVPAASAAPSPPEMRAASIVDDGGQPRLAISWGSYNPPTNVSRSIVEVSTDGGARWQVKVDTTASASDGWLIHWVDGPIDPTVTYQVRARWNTDEGLTGWSNIIEVGADDFYLRLQSILDSEGVTAASLSVKHDGQSDGYTFGQGITTDLSRFRIASLTKPITQTVIRQFIYPTDKPVFCRTASQLNCFLDISGLQVRDERVFSITVEDLLGHQGGWTQNTFDAMFADFEIADSLGLNRSPHRKEIMRYMLANQSLQFAPGNRPAGVDGYSNFGYMLLSLIIEQTTGGGVMAAADERVFSPRQRIAFTEGRTLEPRPNEVSYECEGFKPNVLDFSGPQVCSPYGSFNLENMTGAGSFATTSDAYLEFATRFCLSTGEVRSSCGREWFFGTLDGTETIVRQNIDGSRADGLVLLMNNRLCGDGLAAIHALLNQEFPELAINNVPYRRC